MTTICPNEFLKNSSKYINAGAVIVPADRYAKLEELELKQAIAQGRADIKAGRVYTHEQVFAHLNEKIEQVRKQRNEKL